MKDKKHLVQLILAIITFTVLLIFVVNHLHIISWIFLYGFFCAASIFDWMRDCVCIEYSDAWNRTGNLQEMKKNRLYRFRRPISMVLTYIAALLFIALVLFVVVPEVRIRLER